MPCLRWVNTLLCVLSTWFLHETAAGTTVFIWMKQTLILLSINKNMSILCYLHYALHSLFNSFIPLVYLNIFTKFLTNKTSSFNYSMSPLFICAACCGLLQFKISFHIYALHVIFCVWFNWIEVSVSIINIPHYWLQADSWIIQWWCCHLCASRPAPVDSEFTLLAFEDPTSSLHGSEVSPYLVTPT